ncbi:hypothetical protein Dimus_026841 [Dionaea muscipula]
MGRSGGRSSTARALLPLACRRGGRTPTSCQLKERSWLLHRLLARHTLAARLHCPLAAVLVPARICWPLMEATGCSAPLPARGGCWTLMEVVMLHCSPCSAAHHAPLLAALMLAIPLLARSPAVELTARWPRSSSVHWPRAHCSLAATGDCPREEREHPELYWPRGTAALVPLAIHGDAPFYVASLGIETRRRHAIPSAKVPGSRRKPLAALDEVDIHVGGLPVGRQLAVAMAGWPHAGRCQYAAHVGLVEGAGYEACHCSWGGEVAAPPLPTPYYFSHGGEVAAHLLVARSRSTPGHCIGCSRATYWPQGFTARWSRC